jgi:hypothetical protein
MAQELDTFAERLQRQLQLRGKPISPTALARDFNLRWRGQPISVNAARKWIYGETLPKMEKIQLLAKMLGTSAEWLRWGQSSELSISTTDSNDISHSKLINKQLAESVLHDWSLLNSNNQQLILTILDFLLRQQNKKP